MYNLHIEVLLRMVGFKWWGLYCYFNWGPYRVSIVNIL